VTQFRVAVKDIEERRHEIAAKRAASADSRPFFEYSPTERLSIIQLDIRIPIYNLRNYRTQTRQRSYAHAHDLDLSFFVQGQEDEGAQQAQHEILWTLAQAGIGDSIIPVSSALAQDGRQTEPLLITSDGVIVNGNRRLAAMRELYAEDPNRYQQFATVQCIVLPPGVTVDELKRIEFKLQMRPQTLLPYEWVDEALAVYDLQQSGFPDTEIAMLKRLEGVSDVQAIIERLGEAQIYLDEYLDQPGEYEEVYAHEQQFEDLQKALKQKRTAIEKDCSRKICHVMTKHSRSFGRRSYDYKSAYGARANAVLTRLANRHGIAFEPDVEEGDDLEPDDIFGNGETAAGYGAITELLTDKTISESLATDIKEIVDEIKEEAREQDIGQRALRNAQRANTLLSELSLTDADAATYQPLDAQLQAIHARVTALRADLSTRRD